MNDNRSMFMHVPWKPGNDTRDPDDAKRAYAYLPEYGTGKFVYQYETEAACLLAVKEHNEVLSSASYALNGAKEVVLPSGRYAKMRQLTWMDMINAYNGNPFQMMAVLAMIAVTVDDKAIDADFISTAPLSEALPILSMLGEALAQANKHQGGVK